MKTTTILFDMDGTLLPMDPDRFTAYYFRLLTRRLTDEGYAPKPVIDAIWRGTGAMVKNDGSRPNIDVFWETFDAATGGGAPLRALLERFYSEDFDHASVSCGYAPEAAEILTLCAERGWRTVVATNPIFPRYAMELRLRWAGVAPEDFAYITAYEDSRFCKPNPAYYREILERLGLAPEECVMVGNDTDEDMIAASLGLRVFLLTPCLLNRSGKPLDDYPHGDYAALRAFLLALE